ERTRCRAVEARTIRERGRLRQIECEAREPARASWKGKEKRPLPQRERPLGAASTPPPRAAGSVRNASRQAQIAGRDVEDPIDTEQRVVRARVDLQARRHAVEAKVAGRADVPQ